MLAARALDQGARFDPNALCLCSPEERLTFRDVQDLSWRVVRWLQGIGFAAGKRLAILARNDPMTVVVQVAASRLGVVCLLLNTRSAGPELARLATRAGVEALVFHSDQTELAAAVLADRAIPSACLDRDTDLASGLPRSLEALDPRPQALAAQNGGPARLLATGGTTGLPKLAVASTSAAEASFASVLMSLTRLPPNPVHVAGAPISHAAGSFLYPVMARGGLNVLLPSGEPGNLLAALEAWRANVCFVPPTLLYMMLSHPDATRRDYGALQYLLVAGAPVAPERLREAMRVFGPKVGQFYAQSECLTMITFMDPVELSRSESRLSSCGRPTPLLEVLVADEEGAPLPTGSEGEVRVRGAQVMSGYLDDPEETALTRAGDWHRTGDIGRFDDEGFLHLVDRKRDLIISGGFNVFPREVEDVVMQLTAVQECAVVGMPDPKWGEKVTAFVELKAGANLTAEAVIAHCREALGPVKSPKRVEFCEQLPRSPVGKVLRRMLRDG